MRTVLPHEFFRLDFDQMLEEGKRQENIHNANRGEYSLLQSIHGYFNDEVLPLILNNDWVFESASKFASDYAKDCFYFLKLRGQETYNTQKKLLDSNKSVIDFLGRAYHAGAAPSDTINLSKASDFLSIIDEDKLDSAMYSEAMILLEETRDHEIIQLLVTLQGITGNYETPLPRIMYVVRRAIKVSLNLPPRDSDYELTGISEYISWYTAHVGKSNPLYPVLGDLPRFYKVARNVGSHHKGLKWYPENDEIILEDENIVIPVQLHVFQQKYRHLVYLCELGLRGILSAFCEIEQSNVSNTLVKEYIKSFPEDFPEGEPGVVRFYPV